MKNSGKTKFFDCQVQTSEKTVRGVCFSPEKKSEFDLAQFNKKPIVLKNFKVNNNFGNDNVVMNNKTQIGDSTLTEKEFKRVDIPDTLDIISLTNVAPEQLVSFKAKVVNLGGVKHFETQKGTFTKQEGFLIDPTGSTRIVLWGDYVGQLQQDMTYSFSGLRLKQIDGEKYVNTPKGNYFKFEISTAFDQTLPEVENVSQMINIDVTIDVIGVTSLTKSHSCRACKRRLDIPNEKSVYGKCSNCKMRQKVSAATASWFTKLYVQESCNRNNKLALTANSFILSKIHSLGDLDFHLVTEDEMMERLLDITSLSITYDPTNKKVIDVAENIE